MVSTRFAVLAAIASCVTASPFAPGIVTTKGTHFELNGKPFYFAGTNAYWWTFTKNLSDTVIAMDKAKTAGHEVVRIWGFNEKNATFDPNGLPKYSDEPDGIYFQSWADGKATINYGENGLKHLDKLVQLAERKGLKYTVALTNNWADYFYTNVHIKAAFKNYVHAVVSRYKHSPAIFAWELGNEPRCKADGTRNLPRSPSGCNPAVMTAWAKEMSIFIKSIDPLHMVAVGDEGFFAIDGHPDWPYNGSDGIDTEAFLKIKTIDFGTFHLYCDWWCTWYLSSREPLTWGPDWIKSHAALQRKVGKPVVFEEYGWLTPETRLEYLGKTSSVSRLEAIGLWQRTSIEEKLAGDQYWQFGVDGLSFGQSTFDGFTIYLQNTTESQPLVYEHVKAVKKIRP
ncbi:glycoside hydrolase [Auriculariales sp. MPI-PUGE-AT-0066]|nr:glycoside hydrolase [Auriculariales sp. MPI-PUGE-AT-0066]